MTDTTTPQELDDEFENETEDFDAWRAAQRAKRGLAKPVKVFGEEYQLPTSLPLGFMLEAEEKQHSSELGDLRDLVKTIYGDSALDHWAARGGDAEDLQVLIAFGMARIEGNPVTFTRAAQIVAEAAEQARLAEADAVGKALRTPPTKRPKAKAPGRR